MVLEARRLRYSTIASTRMTAYFNFCSAMLDELFAVQVNDFDLKQGRTIPIT